MSKLPVINAKTFEKILLKLGFHAVRQKGFMFFIAIVMGGIQPYRIIKDMILADH